MFDLSKLSKCGVDFIDDAKFHQLLQRDVTRSQVEEVVAKSSELSPLSVEETAVLLAAKDPELVELIFETARDLKKKVYGNRIVIFAPLYIGNKCCNNCAYCGFRASNTDCVRTTLSDTEQVAQIEALEQVGHKRLILVFGEHRDYSPEYIAECVQRCYKVKVGNGEIRRVNVNAAPLDAAGFKTVHESGIGTYQIFQETYHRETYAKVHPAGTVKGDYNWRLDGLSRAFEVGCDDLGIGALFGLYDWRYETLAMVAHSVRLRDFYGVGPHTLSFPRVRSASGMDLSAFDKYAVNDYDFQRLIAILRLSVPYAGMVLTAREPAKLRREIMAFGVSQIDAGTKLELGGYADSSLAPEESEAAEKHFNAQDLNREQFEIGDGRSLDLTIRDLLADGYVPSFCTSCYRLGRTGEQFMEFAIPGFIQNFCTPNALLTLTEYLVDYGSSATQQVGFAMVEKELAKMEPCNEKETLINTLQRVREENLRDAYY